MTSRRVAGGQAQGRSSAPCVASVAEHAGWAHIVSVGAQGSVPTVVERRRITLIDAGLPTQPYHHDSLRMTEGAANQLVARVRQSIAAHAAESLRHLIDQLAPAHAVVALAIRETPFPDLPDTVAAIWGSHRLYSADGMLYQIAVCDAARQLGLPVKIYPRRGEISVVAHQLGVTPEALERFVSHVGRPAGPPWQAEQRRAYVAGIGALAEQVPGLTIPASLPSRIQ